jgi:hypothetical protein
MRRPYYRRNAATSVFKMFDGKYVDLFDKFLAARKAGKYFDFSVAVEWLNGQETFQGPRTDKMV